MSVSDTLQTFVRNHLAKLLGIAPDAVALDRKLSDYGLDSVDAVLMAGELEEHFDIEINPASFIRYPTFETMIQGLADTIEASGSGAAIEEQAGSTPSNVP